jgi:hypothetical protein
VQQAGVTKWLNDRGVKGKDITKTKFKIEKLIEILKDVPVTIGTQKMGGLKNGHMILLVDYDPIRGAFIVNDPFGSAITNYEDHDGNEVLYPINFLLPFIVAGDDYCRIQYWQGEK